MTNYNVTNSNDAGEGSLREAIALANANEGLDTIEINVADIELISEIEITDSLNITGNGVTITQAGEEQGIFFIEDGNEETFIDNSFVDMTLTGGNSTFEGGAIATSENLVIDNVYFLNNSGIGVGGALHTLFGTTNITNSTFEGNTVVANEEGTSLGAAIYSELGAIVNIDNSLFIGNSGNKGTVEGSQTTLIITDSEIRDNEARGIGFEDSKIEVNNVLVDNNNGQGIVGVVTNIEIQSTTISNNLADYSGGIGVVGLDTSIDSSLIENNTATISGGGIVSEGSANLEITNSIVRSNTAPAGAALEALDRGTILVTDTYIADNVGEDAILGEDITFEGVNANNQNGVLPEGTVGYQMPEDAIGYQTMSVEPEVVEPEVVEPEVVEPEVVEPEVVEPEVVEPEVVEPEVVEPEVVEPEVVEPEVVEPEVVEPEVVEPEVVEPEVVEPEVVEPEVVEPEVVEPEVVEPEVVEPEVVEPEVVEPEVSEPILQTLEVSRTYQTNTGVHMFTTGDDSLDGVEEQSFSLLESNVDELTGETIAGTEIIYQFFNSDTDAYLYTMDTNEVDYIRENLDNYSLEGELYGFESEPQNIETIPIYRMLNTDSGTHMYVEGDELARIQSNFDNFELEAKGEAAFYALDM